MSNFQGGGNRYSDLMGLWAVRGTEQESQISERWNDIVASRFKVRMYQWGGTMMSMAGILFGAVLLGTPLAFAVGNGDFTAMVLVGAVIGCLAILISGGVGYALQESRSQMVVAVITTGLTSFVVLIAVLVTIALSEDMDWWRSALAMAGACIFTPSLALTFFFLSDLVDPMGWISGFERMMRPELKKFFDSEYSKVQETPLFPWNQHSDRKGLLTSKRKGKDMTEDGVEKVPYHLDIELADFLEEALVRGLARDSGWLDKSKNPPFILPSTGATVRRNKYDALIAHAANLGYVHKTDDSTTWAVANPAVEAYDYWCKQIEAEWKEYLDD